MPRFYRMKRFQFRLSFWGACLASALAVGGLGLPAAGAPSAERVRRALASHDVPGARVGVAVVDLASGREVFSQRAEEKFILASNAKLFSTAAAMSLLGEDYHFETRVMAGGDVEGGVLRGDLTLLGGGDPNISSRFHGDALAVPRQWAASVAEAGIRAIRGDLVADDSFFDRQWTAPGWPEDQLTFWYCAPVGALSFQNNCVLMSATGAARNGEPPSVRVSPSFPGIEVANEARTAARGWLVFSTRGTLTFVASGAVRARDTQTRQVTVGDPGLYLAHAFAHALREEGVEIQGRVRRAAKAEEGRGGERLALTRSPLLKSCEVANRDSNNFYAEQIFKTLGAETFGKGSFENGARAAMRFCRQVGIPLGQVELLDGSGLSRGNVATPSTVVKLLAAMHGSDLGEAFRGTLAVSGSDGTLRRRLGDANVRGRIAAKTGTLSGVSTLSGYADARDGGRFAFAILCEGFERQHAARARRLQDAVCRALVGE